MACKKLAKNSKARSCGSGRQTNSSQNFIVKLQPTGCSSKKAPLKPNVSVKKENPKATLKTSVSTKQKTRNSNVTKALKEADTAKKPIVKKTISKTSRSSDSSLKSVYKNQSVLNSKNVKANTSKSKSPSVKKGESSTSKKVIKNEQNKNKTVDNIIKNMKNSNSNIKSTKNVKTIKKGQSNTKATLKKLPVSATSMTAKKNKSKDDELNVRTPVRSGNPKTSLHSPSLSDENNNGRGAINELIRTPVNIVSSALRRVKSIFKN
ncbi:hypothetical protein FG379_003107 [Cryptosporidium bovis]|uniref:uncharacterized protein n=1 Tax=Cryptosporidium bovis TaxID=310047 RepID=UPI00351A3F40|nr:hypothetical protein FG379_003107 [Cryptosporidium bovis]